MRLLIVDDHPLMRSGIRQLVLQHWPDAAVDEAATLGEALACVAAVRPDLVTLDLSLPDARSTDGVSRMLQVLHGVPLLVLSLHAEPAYAARLLQMGAAGYLAKDRAADELCAALHRLSEGGRYVSAAMADELRGLLGDPVPHTRAPGRADGSGG